MSVIRYDPRDLEGKVSDFWNHDIVPAGDVGNRDGEVVR
jgi:hypothetical protein